MDSDTVETGFQCIRCQNITVHINANHHILTENLVLFLAFIEWSCPTNVLFKSENSILGGNYTGVVEWSHLGSKIARQLSFNT